MTADLIVRMFIYFILVILENLFGVYLDIIGEVERMVLYETFLDVSSCTRALMLSCSRALVLSDLVAYMK